VSLQGCGVLLQGAPPDDSRSSPGSVPLVLTQYCEDEDGVKVEAFSHGASKMSAFATSPTTAAASASGTSHRIIVGVRWPAESATAAGDTLTSSHCTGYDYMIIINRGNCE